MSDDGARRLADAYRPLADALGLDGPPPVGEGVEELLASSFPVARAAVAASAALGAALARATALRTGRAPRVEVDPVACVAAFCSHVLLRVDGGLPPFDLPSVGGTSRAADGAWVQIHANYPHHARRACEALGVAEEREAVEAAVARRTGADVEEAVVAAGGCAALARSPAEWRAHPQGRAIGDLTVLDVERTTESPRRPIGDGPIAADGARPLDGVRVLDLTRVIAGPTCGKLLAAAGADVLRVDPPGLPDTEALVIDTGLGKRSCFLDLTAARDATHLRELVAGADVVLEGYRPGALAALGLGEAELHGRDAGLVVVELSAWGHGGPWAARRGFDTLVQMATGLAHDEGVAFGAGGPRHLPTQVHDYATGHLLAAAAVEALSRRAERGGGWRVRCALARTARWFASLRRDDPVSAAGGGVPPAVAERCRELDSPWGRLRHAPLGFALEGVALGWWTGPSRPGADRPVWLAPSAP